MADARTSGQVLTPKEMKFLEENIAAQVSSLDLRKRAEMADVDVDLLATRTNGNERTLGQGKARGMADKRRSISLRKT